MLRRASFILFIFLVALIGFAQTSVFADKGDSVFQDGKISQEINSSGENGSNLVSSAEDLFSKYQATFSKRHPEYLEGLGEKLSLMIEAISSGKDYGMLRDFVTRDTNGESFITAATDEKTSRGNVIARTAALTYKGTTALVTQRPVDPGYLLKLKEGLTTQDMTSDNIVAMQNTGRAEIPLFTELGLKGVRLSKDMQTAAAARTGLSLTNFDEDEMVGRISTLEKVSIV